MSALASLLGVLFILLGGLVFLFGGPVAYQAPSNFQASIGTTSCAAGLILLFLANLSRRLGRIEKAMQMERRVGDGDDTARPLEEDGAMAVSHLWWSTTSSSARRWLR